MIGYNKKILYECFIKLSITGINGLTDLVSIYCLQYPAWESFTEIGRSFGSPRLLPSHARNLFPAYDGRRWGDPNDREMLR